MKIVRNGKAYEVMDGIKSCGVFASMDAAKLHIAKHGEFTPHLRDCQNTKKYDKNYIYEIENDIYINEQILGGVYESDSDYSNFNG